MSTSVKPEKPTIKKYRYAGSVYINRGDDEPLMICATFISKIVEDADDWHAYKLILDEVRKSFPNFSEYIFMVDRDGLQEVIPKKKEGEP